MFNPSYSVVVHRLGIVTINRGFSGKNALKRAHAYFDDVQRNMLEDPRTAVYSTEPCGCVRRTCFQVLGGQAAIQLLGLDLD